MKIYLYLTYLQVLTSFFSLLGEYEKKHNFKV